eukprot:scaffold24550_cov60-Cyclotella_meneghiniana.AAC.15
MPPRLHRMGLVRSLNISFSANKEEHCAFNFVTVSMLESDGSAFNVLCAILSPGGGDGEAKNGGGWDLGRRALQALLA